MRIRFWPALFCLAAVFNFGCVTGHRADPVYHAGDENPPEFLTGPVAVILTNRPGFSAHVSFTKSSPDNGLTSASGELLVREGRMIFQPALALKGKRIRSEGGLFFIWDASKHSGYVLSEALQGYAPVHSNALTAGQLNITKLGTQDTVEGHPCRESEAVAALADGAKARFTLWEADDLEHFPVRIESFNGRDRMTLSFSEIHMEFPAQQLFLLPDGFTAYANAASLMNELLLRDASLNKKYEFNGDPEAPENVRANNWHQQPPPGVP